MWRAHMLFRVSLWVLYPFGGHFRNHLTTFKLPTRCSTLFKFPMTWYVQLGFCNVRFVVSTGEYLDWDHRALQKVPNTFSLCPSGRPSTGNDKKIISSTPTWWETFVLHVHKKRGCYLSTLSSNSALNFVSIFGEHPILVCSSCIWFEVCILWSFAFK